MPGRPEDIYEFGRFRLDPSSRVLFHDGNRVPLSPRALDTLVELVRHEGRVLSRQRLLDRIWPGTVVSEATLTQNVYTLRLVLRKVAGHDEFIETLPRVGYRFLPEVRRIPLTAAEKSDREIRSLAVLPFISLTASEDHRFLGLGLADALIGRLSGMRGKMTVRPTSAILAFAGETLDPRQAARDLRVDAVVQGTIQHEPGRMRVSVQLVDVHQANALWAETFEAASGDLFALQDRISLHVAGALHAELSSTGPELRTRQIETDTAAHQAYVRGRFFWNQRTAESLNQAVGCFDAALERAPTYARAYAGRADARALMPLFGDAAPDDVFPAARVDAQRAIDLDDALAEAHASSAHIKLFYEWRWADAECMFRRAIELDPSYATAYHWFGFLLSATARHDDATAMLERAVDLDPSSMVIRTDLGMTHYFARRYDEAISLLNEATARDEKFAYARFGLSLALIEHGDSAGAIEHARTAVILSSESNMMLALLGHVLARAGRTDEARAVLRRLKSTVDSLASRTALVRVALGPDDQTIDELTRAAAARSRFSVFLAVWPAFDRLRARDEFVKLVEGIGHG